MPGRRARLEVLPAAAAGVRFLPLAWRSAWPALGFACLAFGLWLSAPRDFVLAALALLAIWITQGALWRLAFDWIPHRGGLHIGRLEWRVAASWLLLAAFFAMVALLTLLVLVAVAYGVASSGAGFDGARPDTWVGAATRGRGRLVLGGLALLAVFALGLVVARLSLAGAATADRGRVQVLATWARTRGRAAPLAAAFALLGAGPLALVALAWTRPWGASSAGSGALAGVAGALGLGAWLPLHAGCAAHAWRRLAGEPVAGSRS